MIIYGILGVIFWTGVFLISYRVLKYFHGVQDFGDILAMKLLSMITMIFFMLLLFSNIINLLTHLYLSHDLPFLHALPVSANDIFFSRWLVSLFDSSWMIFTFSIPVFLSYGIIYKTAALYYLSFVPVMFFMCVTASSLSALLVLLGAKLLPAGRIRTILIFLGIFMVILFVLLLRLTRPEQLVNPDTFATVVTYLNSLQMPSSPLLPTTWISDTLQAGLKNKPKILFLNISLTISFSLMVMSINHLLAYQFYFTGFSKSQITPQRLFHSSFNDKLSWENLFNFLPRKSKAFAVKEIRTFFRDSSLWPQLFLMGTLVIIYLYNFSVLPLDKSPIKTVYLQNLFSFLNIALAASVLAAIAARFVFPAVSAEGEAFWIVQTAPFPISHFLWIKFFLYYIPLLILVEILVVVSNYFLEVSPFMMILSVSTIFFLVPAIVGMAIGLGAIYADFKLENTTQAVTSFGGLLFMILSFTLIGIVVILEAGPIYYIVMANLRGYKLSHTHILWTIISFSLVFILCVVTTFYSIYLGKKSLIFQKNIA
jgi:ABC-2 type transport system permease protein